MMWMMWIMLLFTGRSVTRRQYWTTGLSEGLLEASHGPGPDSRARKVAIVLPSNLSRAQAETLTGPMRVRGCRRRVGLFGSF
ncbi:hypothetical protein QC761_0048910 [Podospora bellae-mahoneyi]|uniref:Secreted protein n=1 Tax=Podospora bellae-mahoneyi TaxID=2093777 RepID=A0ABR0FM45_9PEZI|nr:hypothetical protein QC761_0048910 [Podospora bellae-mahoneyi]